MVQRYRTQGALDLSGRSETFRIWSSCSESSWVSVQKYQLYPVGVKRIMYDTVTPGFHRRRKAGHVIMNDLYRQTQTGIRTEGNGIQRSVISPTNCSGTFVTPVNKDDGNHMEVMYASSQNSYPISSGSFPAIPDLFGSDISRAVIESATSVRNQRGRHQDGNLWESLAESDKALGTLTGIFKSTYQTIRSRNLKGFTKNVTGGYLGWRYGIKPMLSDVDLVMKGLSKKAGERARITSRAKVTLNDYRSRVIPLTYDFAKSEIIEQIFDTAEIRAMSLDETILSEANNIGLTTKGLLTTPWELVRLSFVADWFANMGDFIGSMVPAFGWTQLGSCVVVKRTQRLEISSGSTVNNGTVWTVNRPLSGGYTYSLETLKRSAGLPQPEVVVRSDFRFSNLTRCLDAFSLLAQQVINRR